MQSNEEILSVLPTGTALAGRTALVTGATSGIGEAGARVAEDITASTGTRVEVAPLDLADIASIEAFVAAWEGPLHVLVAPG